MDAGASTLRSRLGGCTATGEDGVEHRLSGRLPPVILAVLASERHRAVPRGELAESLWGDGPPATWEASLRMAVSRLRAFLVAAGFDPGAVASTGGGYQLRLGEAIRVDLDEASGQVEAAERALASGRLRPACDLAAEARSLLDAPLLPGSEGPWVDAARRRARSLLMRALEVEAEARGAGGEASVAVVLAGRAVELEPFHESAHRALMRAHARAGNKAEALRCHERCRRLLAEELGVDPAPATEAVHLHILRDEPLPSPIPPPPPDDTPPAGARSLPGGRDAVARRRWEEAFMLLSRADEEDPLGPRDLEGLGEAALWTGRHRESAAARQRAHSAHLEAGDRRSAARVALALASNHGIRGELAGAEGWFRTAARLLASEPEGPEQGFLASVAAIVLFETGALAPCLEQARQASDAGERWSIPDLQALGIALQGVALARQEQATAALPMLDEGMALAMSGRVTPFAAGIIFCRTIRTALDLFDHHRAAEWIDTVERSAEATGFAGYPGDCSAHLAAALQARGSWSEAEREAERACAACEGFELSHVGLAWYTLGEIHLRRGDLRRADEAFRLASEHGMTPLPGLASLQLARGDAAGALASISSWLEGTSIPLARARVLPAAVEIALAAGRVTSARAAAKELARIAEAHDSAALRAAAARARGALRLAAGDAAEALNELRQAVDGYRRAEMPYEAAGSRRLLAEALLAHGDRMGAVLELEAAGRLFERLGAGPDARASLGRGAELVARLRDRADGGLTADQVLGMTRGNR